MEFLCSNAILLGRVIAELGQLITQIIRHLTGEARKTPIG